METVFIFSEITFNFVVSVAVITVGVLFVFIVVPMIRILRELEKFSSNLNQISSDAVERINDIVDRFSELPIFSFFLKDRSRKIKKTSNIGSAKKM